VDVRERRKWAFPLVVIGTNAIAAYLGPSIVPTRRIAEIFTKLVAQQIGAFGPLFSTAAVLLINWAILHWMYKRKIFLKA
jgi:predicted acyltransferase